MEGSKSEKAAQAIKTERGELPHTTNAVSTLQKNVLALLLLGLWLASIQSCFPAVLLAANPMLQLLT